MRLAKTMDYLIAAQKALDERDPVTRLLLVLDGCNLALRMVFDNLQWATKAGVYAGDDKALGRTANTFWLIGISLSVIRGLYLLHKLGGELREHKEHNNVHETARISRCRSARCAALRGSGSRRRWTSCGTRATYWSPRRPSTCSPPAPPACLHSRVQSGPRSASSRLVAHASRV